MSKVPIEEEDVGCAGAGVTGGYKLPGVVVGNRTQVHQNNSDCS